MSEEKSGIKAQHGTLTAERWREFSFEQQVLMIGNEMNRASKLMAAEDRERLRACYERVLALVDLSVQVQELPTRRRELLRWRDLAAALFISETSQPAAHAEALACLLRFTSVSAAQIPFVLSAR